MSFWNSSAGDIRVFRVPRPTAGGEHLDAHHWAGTGAAHRLQRTKQNGRPQVTDPLIFGSQCHSFLFIISQIGIETSTFYIVILLGVFMVLCGRAVRRLACFGAALTWLCLGLKSAEELWHSPLWGSTVRTLVDCPMGRFARTYLMFFQITKPGNSTVTPLYQKRRQVPIEAASIGKLILKRRHSQVSRICQRKFSDISFHL